MPKREKIGVRAEYLWEHQWGVCGCPTLRQGYWTRQATKETALLSAVTSSSVNLKHQFLVDHCDPLIRIARSVLQPWRSHFPDARLLAQSSRGPKATTYWPLTPLSWNWTAITQSPVWLEAAGLLHGWQLSTGQREVKFHTASRKSTQQWRQEFPSCDCDFREITPSFSASSSIKQLGDTHVLDPPLSLVVSGGAGVWAGGWGPKDTERKQTCPPDLWGRGPDGGCDPPCNCSLYHMSSSSQIMTHWLDIYELMSKPWARILT